MNTDEEAIIKRLLELSRSGTRTEARLEVGRSLALYRHHPQVQKRLLELSESGAMEPSRLAAIRILGGRSPDG